MIPKVIHYCWFGGKEMPGLYQKCIESWKRYCPDY
ncbi:glycosyl transferase, partial [Klebsiella oxytoca]